MKNLISDYLNDTEINFETISDTKSNTIYRIGFNLKNGLNEVLIDIRTNPGYILINTYSPINIPLEYRAKVSEFILRVNAHINIGSFNLDFTNENIYYKTSFMFEHIHQDQIQIFHENLRLSLYRMDKYIPGILSIIYGNKDPQDAFNTIENIIKPELN